MEQSSSEKSDNGRLMAATERDSNALDGKDAARRMIADRLLAALATGNLEHLERAREAFLNQGRAEDPAQLNGKPSAPTKEEAPLSEQDYLSKEATETATQERAR